MLKWPEVKRNYETDYDYFNRVHWWAKSVFLPSTDLAVWGFPDHWETKNELEELASRNNGMVPGDCDSFVSLCRHAIAQSGIPSRIVGCWTSSERSANQYHGVAETASGWVFDILSDYIATWKLLQAKDYVKDIMGPLCNPTIQNDDISWTEAL